MITRFFPLAANYYYCCIELFDVGALDAAVNAEATVVVVAIDVVLASVAVNAAAVLFVLLSQLPGNLNFSSADEVDTAATIYFILSLTRSYVPQSSLASSNCSRKGPQYPYP